MSDMSRVFLVYFVFPVSEWKNSRMDTTAYTVW